MNRSAKGAAVLALVAFVLARAGKLRPAWQAAIWLVVTIKLALPWGPAMPYSLSDVIAMFRDHTASAPVLTVAPSSSAAAAAPQAWPAVGWIALAIIWMIGATWVVVRSVLAQRATAKAARSAAPASPDALALLQHCQTASLAVQAGVLDGDASPGANGSEYVDLSIVKLVRFTAGDAHHTHHFPARGERDASHTHKPGGNDGWAEKAHVIFQVAGNQRLTRLGYLTDETLTEPEAITSQKSFAVIAPVQRQAQYFLAFFAQENFPRFNVQVLHYPDEGLVYDFIDIQRTSQRRSDVVNQRQVLIALA
jgi:hypothetical protein